MKTRIIAGVTAAVLLLLLILCGTVEMMLLACLLSGALAYTEFDRLFFPNHSRLRQLKVVILIGFAILLIHYRPSSVWIYLWLTFVFHSVTTLISCYRSGDCAKAVRDLTLELFGFVYVVSLFGFLVPIAGQGTEGRRYLLLLFFLVFMGDTAAYFAGKYFGKHRLAPAISPSKTWEGALGALLATFSVTVLWIFFIYHGERTTGFLWKILLFAPAGNILAQLGDLFESLLKRSQAQKDSGSFLPGHGGILDRVDGLVFAAPGFYFYLVLVLGRS